MSTDPFKYIGSVAPVTRALAEEIYRVTRTIAPTIWIGQGKGPSTEHSTGLALDVMVSEKRDTLPSAAQKKGGDALVALLVASAKTLHIQHILWDGKIYRTRNSAWGILPNRTANSSISDWHYDHIHIFLADDKGKVAELKSAVVARPFSLANVLLAMRTLKYDGNTTTVQGRLKAKGFYPYKVDGIFGPKTAAGYKAYQLSIGLKGKDADGIPGKYSMGKLLEPDYYVV